MTARGMLLEQLQAVYVENNWFACFNMAVKDLQEPQVFENQPHSIVELVHHLYFYNERYLSRFRGEEIPEFPRHYDTC